MSEAGAVLQLMADSVAARARLVSEAIEVACELALQGGVCGVLVVDCGDHCHVGPHRSVPYGVIHEFPRGAPPDLRDELHRG